MLYINIKKDGYYSFIKDSNKFWQQHWGQLLHISINGITLMSTYGMSDIIYQNPIYLKMGKYLYSIKYFFPSSLSLNYKLNPKYCETDSKGNVIQSLDLFESAERVSLLSALSTNKINAYLKFCTNINPYDNKPYYETDIANCSAIIPELSKSRCIKDNIFQDNDSYCINYSNNNINDSNIYITEINKARKNKAIDDLKNGIKSSNYSDQKIITNDASYKYLIEKFPLSTSIYSESDVLIPELLSFCETYDGNYLKNPNGQCFGFYNAYSNTQKIKNSRQNMRQTLCKDYNNITTNLPDDSTTNAYKCSDMIFNKNLNDILLYEKNIANYCQKDSNITNAICKNYYSNIEEIVLNELKIKYK